MDSRQKLAAFLQKRVEVDPEETQAFVSAFTEKKLRKKQWLVQPGFVATHRYYLIDGALRSFLLTENGQEITIALAIADWWISDYNSYIYQQPATLFVEAISNSTVMQLSFAEEQRLKAANPKFETFFRIIAERGLAAQQRRIIAQHTQSAQASYDSFRTHYADFLHEIPQYIIASFLGMSTEFLSKIRNQKVPKRN
ncbi:Crp/Fnr family transcriptional regulator [Marinilongibacter aquaticus]|uniref:Crp/Fnr family transcriptional regulator n=1 Tax=Marinilongibacter aquaticus TaxID=2975157 RepID=UPI0021BD449D|nr:Crp/Fnr family transcriptional regulator [Marinilongibacter aquaticus]UBM59992.1 Crp/Fnr family transcriptional regulator [Marinilongibacter aquaticus]